jgi:hypothetical protein
MVMPEQAGERKPQEIAALEALFADFLRRYLEAQLWPMLSAIDQLVAQLVEQLEARERIARSYLEQNRELRVEVARLAENVAAMRNATTPDAMVN